jgi:hypothetical protein
VKMVANTEAVSACGQLRNKNVDADTFIFE